MPYIPTPVDRLQSSAQKIDALAWMLYASVHSNHDLKPHAEGLHSLFEEEARDIADVVGLLQAREAGGNAEATAMRQRKQTVDRIAAEMRASMEQEKGLRSDPETARSSVGDTILGDLERAMIDAIEQAGVDRHLAAGAFNAVDRLRETRIATKVARGKGGPRFRVEIDEAEARRLTEEDAESDRLHRQADRIGTAFDPMTPEQLRDRFIKTSMRDGVDAADIAEALNMKRAAVDKLIAQMTPQRRPDAPPAAHPE